MTPDKIVRNFQRCVNWEEKYLYMIELGERFCTLESEKCTDDYRVSGCQSQVWISIDLDNDCLKIKGMSDAVIVRGLIALIIIAFNGCSLDQAKTFDLQKWFNELELTQHLTPSRAVGLSEIVKSVYNKL
ncbi:SufE family protein [Photobacterium damselae subsp. damselae]|uniref:SufE family protein n=1 Tax=Photobacterium damselae TaxID=38293 RepID=UPI00311AF3F0